MIISMAMARKLMGITQIELKKILGTTQGTISKIENGYFPHKEIRDKFDTLFAEWRISEIARIRMQLREIESLEVGNR